MESPLTRVFTSFTQFLDRARGWDRLPRPLGLMTLYGIRVRLRHRNLYDTGAGRGPRLNDSTAGKSQDLTRRTIDGSFNDLSMPAMGSIGSRFGRNVPLERTWPDEETALMDPSPRTVSLELLTRRQFIPAATLNVLAAAWLQFEVHDWFSHGKNESENPWELDLDPDDKWPERPMRIPRTRRDPTWRDEGTPPTFVTADSHWWDGSQIYGSDEAFATKIRSGEGGKLRLDEYGLLPRDLEEGVDLSGVAGNWWVGLALLHTLFTLEHNAICDRLRNEYTMWSDEQLYHRARLINAALMAKIHTVEWTPAIIAHPTTRLAMNANWWGLVGEGVTRRFGRLGSGDLISGVPGSRTDHHGVPYSLTEEFVAVYRMHPLLPDDFTFRSCASDEILQQRSFPELGALQARARLEELSIANALYSFGIAHPGAITLHNYPRSLQDLKRPDGTILDLAATDILRNRERGVPRYNEFRSLFHLKPARTFEELTGNSSWAKEIEEVYRGDIDRVDLMIGLYAERLPRGFGFSDTAFRVFSLMAPRRLKSDRFFTVDYTPEIYTKVGLEWINQTTMSDIVVRHYPELEPSLRGVGNAFAPWNRMSVEAPDKA